MNFQFMYEIIQAPLQPLADNLDSAVYNTFEQDLTKYRKYREAVEAALKDIGGTGRHAEEAVVYVLGAGRGPLVRQIGVLFSIIYEMNGGIKREGETRICGRDVSTLKMNEKAKYIEAKVYS